MKTNKEKWQPLLKEGKAFCYIKPNRHVHESGYRCFEVGYLTLSDDRKCQEKLVLSEYSDHFCHRKDIETNQALEFNMDVLRDGYMRIFGHRQVLTWENSYDWTTSSFSLSEMEN